MTPTEKKVFEQLLHLQKGLRVRAQEPLYGYIADFWLPQLWLVIELDGSYHQYKEDKFRDSIFANHGITTKRISLELLREDRKIPSKIVRAALKRISHYIDPYGRIHFADNRGYS